jgi:biopolymer transport protein ExbD
MRRRSVLAKPSEEEDINITPLLDIVFIMLIFFIVTSTFIKEPGVKVLRVDAATAIAQKPISLLVAVDENDQIWINKQQVELSEVKVKVKELRREIPRGGAVLQADAKAKSGLVLDVLQEIRDAGVDDFAIATKQN